MLLAAGVQIALVLLPMSAQSATLAWRSDSLIRTLCRRRLNDECEQLRRHGIDVHVFKPDAATLAAMGLNALDDAKSPRVLRNAFLAAGEQLANDRRLTSVLSRHRTAA